jgi:hypothetical protein
MRGFIGKKFQETYVPTLKEYAVVNSLEVRGVEKELVVCCFDFFLLCR